jgi:WD40 repeat protein
MDSMLCRFWETVGLVYGTLRTGRLESTLPHPDGISFGCGGFRPAEGIALAIEAPCILAWSEVLLCVWDLRAGTRVKSLLVSKVRDAAITPDGNGVVFTDGDNVRFWSPVEGTSRQLETCDPDAPYHVAISPDGKRALSTAGRDVSLWRLDGPIQNAKDARINRYIWLGTHDKPSAVAFAGPEKAIIRSGTHSLFMFDPRKWTSTSSGLDDSDLAGLNRAAPLSEGRLFAISSYGGPITVWNLHEQRSMTVLTLHPGTVGRVSDSAKRLLLSSPDGVLKVVSLVDQSLLVAFQGDKQIVTCDGDEGLQWVGGRDENGQMHFFCVESPSL